MPADRAEVIEVRADHDPARRVARDQRDRLLVRPLDRDTELAFGFGLDALLRGLAP